MKIRSLFTVVLGFFLWTSTSAQECKRFEFQGQHNQMWYLDALFGFHFGYTSYKSDAFSASNGMPENLKSLKRELVFPLDITMTGLSLRGPLSLFNDRPGQITGNISINIKEPFRRMTEKSWSSGTMESSLRYNPKLTLFDFSMIYDFQLFDSRRSVFELSTKLAYQNIQQDMIGYGGWFMDSETGQKQDVNEIDRFMIDYKVSFFSIESGISYHFFPNKIIQFVFDPHAGIVFANDRDKHFHELRVTDASSFGFLFGLDTYCIIQPKLLNNISFFYRSGLSYISGTGNQTESWFKDGPNVTAGSVFNDISQKMLSLQYHFTLGIGYILSRAK